MAVVGDIYNALDAFCPFDVHEQWDNVGLLVGESSAQVTRAAVVLDITPDAVERAHEAGAQLIISHHPVIFHPIKNLGAHDPVYLLAKYGMSAICAHTNLDCADGGVNDVLAQCLGLENVRKIPSPNAGTMLLRAGELREELSPKQFAELVSQRLCCHVRYCDGGRSIKRVALCGGAGGGGRGRGRYCRPPAGRHGMAETARCLSGNGRHDRRAGLPAAGADAGVYLAPQPGASLRESAQAGGKPRLRKELCGTGGRCHHAGLPGHPACPAPAARCGMGHGKAGHRGCFREREPCGGEHPWSVLCGCQLCPEDRGERGSLRSRAGILCPGSVPGARRRKDGCPSGRMAAAEHAVSYRRPEYPAGPSAGLSGRDTDPDRGRERPERSPAGDASRDTTNASTPPISSGFSKKAAS